MASQTPVRKTEFILPATDSTGHTVHHTASHGSFLGVPFEDEEKPDFSDPKTRRTLTVVVFAVIALQLLLTILFTAVFLRTDASDFVVNNTWVIWVALLIFLVPYFMIVCCETSRREFPTNIVLLFFLSVGMIATSGFTTGWFQTIVIIYSEILTLIAVIVIIILAVVYTLRYTYVKCIFVLTLIFLAVFGLAAIPLSSFSSHSFKTFFYPGICIALLGGFLLYDMKAIMTGRRNIHITPTSFVFATSQVYADVIGIFITFLEIVGTITEND